MYDLTQPLTEDIPRFPGDPQVRVEALEGFAPWQVSALCMGTHSGTHLDAPRHRFPPMAGIGEYGPQRLVGRGVVVDARGMAENEAMSAAVLDGLRDRLASVEFALMRTGWDQYWGEETYYRHPYLSPDLARALMELGIGIVAIDTLSVDSTVDLGSQAHEILLAADVLIAENLCHLDTLETGRSYAFAFLPLPLGSADGSPARVVAWSTAEI